MCSPYCPYENCNRNNENFIEYHDVSFCGGCYITTKRFCYKCGVPYCCWYEMSGNELCAFCKKRNPLPKSTDCARDHSCKGGCGVRFCKTQREPGIVYVDPLSPEQKRSLHRDLRDHCRKCLLNLALKNKHRTPIMLALNIPTVQELERLCNEL